MRYLLVKNGLDCVTMLVAQNSHIYYTFDTQAVTPKSQTLIGRVINAVLGIAGSLALAMFIYRRACLDDFSKP